MGRPFDAELSHLGDTYQFATDLEIDRFALAVRRILDFALISVGSGGSFTAAAMLQRLHQAATGIPGLPLTPLQLDGITSIDPASAIWLLSARGRNPDILAAAKAAISLEPEIVLSLTATEGTKLRDTLHRNPVGLPLEFESPAGKDGFLATNSLLATCVLLWRAYHVATGRSDQLPSFEQLTGIDSVSQRIISFDRNFASLWHSETIVLLYGKNTSVAAIDIESKIMEAALSPFTFSDLRSFGHGRHHWLSRFGDKSGVLVLADPESATLAEKTIELLPKNVESRILRLRHGGLLGELEGLITGFILTASLGHARNVDPGRPGIAAFGSTIYHLRDTYKLKSDVTNAAIARKIVAGAPADYEVIKRSAVTVIEKISVAKFGAILFDLDGTLVGSSPDERYARAARPQIATELARLSGYGVKVAIATGRGPTDTTHELLRSLLPSKYWSSVLVGYHNGAEISYLTDPNTTILSPLDVFDRQKLCKYLGDRLQSQDSDVKIRDNPCQITLRSASSDVIVRPHHLFVMAQEAITAVNARAKAVRSSHSVDIVSLETSKSSIAATLDADLSRSSILRIGDSGAWPGNDFELLSHEYGLSVDRVSTDLNFCWNLLPRGTRATEGALFYLARLKRRRGTNTVGFDDRLMS